MKTIRNLRHLLIGATALLLAGCEGPCNRIAPITGPEFNTGSADLTRVAAIGTSISAGYQSGGLVIHHQQRAFPVLFAQHVGAVPFTIPAVSANGIPPLLRLRSISPLVINNLGRTAGVPLNTTQVAAFSNLAVPGALLGDVTSTLQYPRSPFFDIVTRNRGTILSQMASLSPTFITFELGSSEILGPGFVGSGVPLMTPEDFATLLTSTMNAIAQAIPGAQLALVNVPDPINIPFFNTFSPIAPDTNGVVTPLIGPGDVPLGPGDYVLLTAGDSLAVGTGFGTGTRSYLTGVFGNGRPLPDSLVLTVDEALSLRTAMFAYDAVIDTVARARGAARVDLLGLLREVATTGYTYRGLLYNSDFLTGGLFSLDGVHPTDFAHGLVCNALIAAINDQFGATIQFLDLSTIGTTTSSVERRGAKIAPWIQKGSAADLFPWRSTRGPS